MKKLLTALLAIILSLGVFGCTFPMFGQHEENSSESLQSPEISSEEVESTVEELNPEDFEWGDDGVLKILTVGNSFSDDAMEWVYKIAESAGVQVYLGNLYIGSCTLKMHLNNVTSDAPIYDYRTNENGKWKTAQGTPISTALKAQNWDYISFQQSSGQSGDASTYTDLDTLLFLIKREVNEDAKFVWHMTWAYKEKSSHPDFPKYNSSQAYMYEKIVETVETTIITNDEFAKIIPTGTAIQNARTVDFIGDTLTRDGYHLTEDLGRYIAGLTLFATLSDVSLDRVTFIPPWGVNEEEKQAAIKAVQSALEVPFSVTEQDE